MDIGFWLGFALAAIGAFHAVVKVLVIWGVASDPHGGGGAPTLDFVLFSPLFLAVGVALVLRALVVAPFPYFGVALYAALVVVAVAVHEALGRIGASRRRRGEPQ